MSGKDESQRVEGWDYRMGGAVFQLYQVSEFFKGHFGCANCNVVLFLLASEVISIELRQVK